MFTIYLFIYFIIIFFLLYSIISSNKCIVQWSIALCAYFLFKWIFDYHKCTISYIECKIRNVKKEDGIIYNFLNNIMCINQSKCRYIIYSIVFAILIINLNKNFYFVKFSN